MADDPDADDGAPDPVRQWLSGVAEERQLGESELLDRLLEGGGGDGAGGSVGLEERVDELEDTVDGLDAELEAKITDVRDRVIQVKRETDAKAASDHGHDELSGEVDRLDGLVGSLGGDLVDLTADVDDLRERVEAVDGRLEAGFANFEEVLEYLLDTTDDVTDRVATLARATVAVRGRLDRIAAEQASRSAAERLQISAHEHGVAKAVCEACGGAVSLGLLAAPECPHCAASFTELEPRRGFFRSSVLHTGERPALEGAVDGRAPDLDSLADGLDDPAPAFDPGPDVEPDSEGGASSEQPEQPAASVGTDVAPLEVIEGIGPAYADRLRSAGVETVTDLALADPERLAREADIAQGRVETLVSRARTHAGVG